MLPNTTTTFQELRKGDRFRFVSDPAQLEYELTDERLLGKQGYNYIKRNGKPSWPKAKRAQHHRPVIFLYHTLPAPGVEWPLNKLQKGDVFNLPGNYDRSYIVTYNNAHGHVQFSRRTASSDPMPTLARDQQVIFIGKSTVLNRLEQLTH